MQSQEMDMALLINLSLAEPIIITLVTQFMGDSFKRNEKKTLLNPSIFIQFAHNGDFVTLWGQCSSLTFNWI